MSFCPFIVHGTQQRIELCVMQNSTRVDRPTRRPSLDRAIRMGRASHEARPSRAEALIERYGGRAVLFGHFVSVLSETIAWVAGLVRYGLAAVLFHGAADAVIDRVSPRAIEAATLTLAGVVRVFVRVLRATR
jgi:hypothetical protein